MGVLTRLVSSREHQRLSLYVFASLLSVFCSGVVAPIAPERKESTVQEQANTRSYAAPRATKVGRVATDTLGTIHTKKDATTPGFKKPR